MLKSKVMKASLFRYLWIIYFLSLVPAFITLYHRTEFDSGFKSVALVADYFQLLELSQTENVPVERVLNRLKNEAGISAVALLEDTPEFLAQRGLCTIVEGVGWPGWKTEEEREKIKKNRGREPEEAQAPGDDWPLLMGLPHDKTHLIFHDDTIFRRVADGAVSRYPGLVETREGSNGGGVISLAGEPKIVLKWGFGFDPQLLEYLRSEGFTVYPRLRNYPGFSKSAVSLIFRHTFDLFPREWIIFEGDSIVGSNGELEEVIRVINDAVKGGWTGGIGWVEFAEQKGAHSLAYRVPNIIARVHSIEDEEMEVISPDRAVARYLRAVRERTVRIVYLKPFLLSVDSLNRVDKSLKMFAGVKESLESRGFVIGEPSRISDKIRSNILTRLALSIALGSGLILLVHLAFGRIGASLAITLFVITLGLSQGLGTLGLKLSTLGIALEAPLLALFWVVRRYIEIENLQKMNFLSSAGSAISLWLGAIAITLTGGLLIAASLINHLTLLKIDSFSGVKLALYLPILLSLMIGVQLILPPEKRTFYDGLTWLLSVPIKVWHILLGFLALVVLFIMLDRSGNFPVIEVADWENKLRGWFETILYARPRTKEAFIGHPAMVMGLFLGLSSMNIRKSVAYAGLVIGSIALTSLTNTFCHIHTPLELSIFRTIAGIVIGGLLGLAGGIVILWFRKLILVFWKMKSDIARQ